MLKIINIMAVSLDGRIAVAPLQNDEGRMQYGFGCKADHDFVKEQIKDADAVITGANSVRSMGGVWDQKRRDGNYPTWFVYTDQGIDSHLTFWQQRHIPRRLVSRTERPTPEPIEQLNYGSHKPGQFLVDHLQAKKFSKVLLFGGGWVNAIFYDENLVNELKLTISPVIVGVADAPYFVNPTLSRPRSFDLVSSHSVDNHLFLHYSIREN